MTGSNGAPYVISKEEVEKARKKAHEIKMTYGIGVPWQLLLYVRPGREDEVVAGVHKDFLQLTRADRFIARPVGFRVYDYGAVFKYPNGVKARMELPEEGPRRIEAFRKALKSVHLVWRNGYEWRVSVLEAHEDPEAAKKCVEERGWASCLGLAVGYSEAGAKAYWWRYLPLLTGVHTLEMTQAGTGKTTFYVTLSRALNVAYLNELPSYAYLIADARDGSLGVVAIADILVIDEIDKLKVAGEWAYSSLLSGMEQGVWQRAKGKAVAIENPLSVVLQGNCGVLASCGARYTRGQWELVLTKLLKVNAGPLVDRIALVVNSAPRIGPTHISEEVLRPAATRALVKMLNEGFNIQRWVDDPRRDKQLSAIWHIYRLVHGQELSKGDLAALWEEGP